MNNILLVIAARAGSKGVKGKNIRPLAGHPLIAYTIKQALNWGKAKRVVVSTDSPEIADIAQKYGVQTPFLRPAELATDTASKGMVLKHALRESEKYFNERYDIVVDLDVTAPIRSEADLDNALELFLKKDVKTLFSVFKAHKNPYFNMVERCEDGRIALCKTLPGGSVYRRQDAPEVYAMNASIYFYRRDYILKSEIVSPFSDRMEIYVMDDMSGVDIDREIDFRFIEFLCQEGILKI